MLGSIGIAFLISVIFFYYSTKGNKNKLPPLASLSNSDVIQALRSGNIHLVEKDLADKHGSVYRLKTYGERNGIFILSNPSALRKMLDDDEASDKV